MTQQPETPITGGCLCGKIRYAATGPIDFPHVCSCGHCQRLSGGPMQAWVDVPLEGFSWTGPGGEPIWYNTFPTTKRGFCPTCGSSVSAYDDGGEAMGLTMMSLDDHGTITPTSQSFKQDGVSWLPLIPWQQVHDEKPERAAAVH